MEDNIVKHLAHKSCTYVCMFIKFQVTGLRVIRNTATLLDNCLLTILLVAQIVYAKKKVKDSINRQ